MRHSFIVIAVALVGCAKTSHDASTQDPAQIEREVDAAEQSSTNSPEDTTVSRVYVDEKILEACKLSLPQAFFDFDSSKLEIEDQVELHDVAMCLKEGALKDTRVGIVGHTDPRGSTEFNDELGEERAESVASFLVKCGVEPDRLQTDSLGEEMASTDADDWPADRRVDIILRSEPN